MAHAICLAEAVRRSLQIEIYSAGLMNLSGTPPAEAAVSSCLQYQTPIPKERSMFIGDLPLNLISHFLVMEHRHAAALVDDYGISPKRITLLGKFDPQRRDAEISDPSDQGIAAIERCCSRIRECVFSYLDTTYEEPRRTDRAAQPAALPLSVGSSPAALPLEEIAIKPRRRIGRLRNGVTPMEPPPALDPRSA